MRKPEPDGPPDLELLDRIRQNDFDAFQVLVTRYQDRVYGLALSMLRDEVEAQDVVQDTFLNVFRKLDSYRGEAAFSAGCTGSPPTTR